MTDLSSPYPRDLKGYGREPPHARIAVFKPR